MSSCLHGGLAAQRALSWCMSSCMCSHALDHARCHARDHAWQRPCAQNRVLMCGRKQAVKKSLFHYRASFALLFCPSQEDHHLDGFNLSDLSDLPGGAGAGAAAAGAAAGAAAPGPAGAGGEQQPQEGQQQAQQQGSPAGSTEGPA